MSPTASVESISGLVKPWVADVVSPAPDMYDVATTPANLVPIVSELCRARWGYLTAITARESGAPSGPEKAGEGAAPADHRFEIYYHFCRGPAVLNLRITVPYEKPVVPSICGVLPSASLQERELAETFGIEVEGLPKSGRLFLSEDWPAGLYPLRKENTPQTLHERTAAAPPRPATVEPDTTPGRFTIPIGPQHPALKEPAHFELGVDGEIVTDVSLRLGYVHRGIEKAAENRTWVQNLYLMERICGICSHIHTLAYVLGAEKLAGVATPPRAQAIRVLIAEMERLHSHLLWLGVAAHEAGFDTLFMYTWRDRETIMDLLEQVSGNRVNYSMNLLGGVKCDVDPSRADAIRRGLDLLEPRIQHYLNVVTTDESFLRRTRGIGIFPTDRADFLGVVGPTLRASGVHRDIRVDAPYGAYKDFPITPVFDEGCDLAARVTVRVKELQESCRHIRAVLDSLPKGDLAVDFPRRVPEGETISRVEAPRGELFYYLHSAGGVSPDRMKVRTPSLSNWAYVLSVAVGHRLADIPMIVVGIDPCFSCNDRTFLIRQAGREGVLGWEDLRRYAIQWYGGRVE